jgi:two-component system NarL family sensor kinase
MSGGACESYREVILYRITQELITNVIRHARASQIMVQIVFDQKQLAITVEDDGRGFEPGTIGHHKGMGLSNIKSRVAFLNGQLNVDTSAGSGTSVYIEVPV